MAAVDHELRLVTELPELRQVPRLELRPEQRRELLPERHSGVAAGRPFQEFVLGQVVGTFSIFSHLRITIFTLMSLKVLSKIMDRNKSNAEGLLFH